jgi:hypothetical protein
MSDSCDRWTALHVSSGGTHDEMEVVIFTWHYGTHKTSGARTAKGFLQAFVFCPETHRKGIPTSREILTRIFFDGSCSASQLWSWHWHCARVFQQPF